MWLKTTLAFVAAVGISLPAAVHRFRDSGHAVGRLSAGGGSARHAVQLDPGKRQYAVAVSGIVMPPYRGDARVAVEGHPEMAYEIHRSGPVLDLGIHRKPTFHDGVLAGLEPQDRFTLWVVMRPRHADWDAARHGPAWENTVTFRDMATGRTVLEIPIVYQPENKEVSHADHS